MHLKNKYSQGQGMELFFWFADSAYHTNEIIFTQAEWQLRWCVNENSTQCVTEERQDDQGNMVIGAMAITAIL